MATGLEPIPGCPGCAALAARVAELERQVAELLARVNQNSRNSSRPPSSDPPNAPPRRRKPPSGLHPGGQPGHEPNSRPLLPPEQCSAVLDHRPATCGECGGPLSGDDPDPLRNQVTELPPVKPTVTEHRRHALRCARCGEVTRADLPPGTPPGAFGPRVTGLVALLTGAYHLSKRAVEVVLEDCFGIEMALGSVSNLEQAATGALAAPVAEARTFVQALPSVNADETGWWEKARRAWLWVASTLLVTVFLVRRSRGALVAQELLGRGYAGVVGSDRWSGYRWIALEHRQLCWAHLGRDFEAIAEAGGDAARVGKGLLDRRDLLFKWWHRVRDGTLRHSSFRTYVDRLRPEVFGLLQEGTRCGDRKTEGMCREILGVEEALWTFVKVPGVEPTNNAAERALRPAVLWRKGSFGTHSPAGSVFVERVLTAVTTLRQQGRHVLDYLTAACEAALRGEPAPSLLPAAASAGRQAA